MIKTDGIEVIKESLLRVPEVKDVQIYSYPGLDAYFHIKVKGRRSFELSTRLADIISEAKIRVLEETGELPAVEWDYETDDK